LADPVILDLTGTQMELRVFRGQDAPMLVAIRDSLGAVVPLTNYDVTLTVVDRAGGTVKFTDTNIPADHSNATGGETRFVVPASAYSGLTGQRPFTWKYQIFLRDRLTNQKYPVFWGDYRVLAPHSTV
jgi:hypothetical protein